MIVCRVRHWLLVVNRIRSGLVLHIPGLMSRWTTGDGLRWSQFNLSTTISSQQQEEQRAVVWANRRFIWRWCLMGIVTYPLTASFAQVIRCDNGGSVGMTTWPTSSGHWVWRLRRIRRRTTSMSSFRRSETSGMPAISTWLVCNNQGSAEALTYWWESCPRYHSKYP